MLSPGTDTRDWAGTLRISKTQMQTYLMCPRKFYFQYVVALPWEFMPESLPFGRALHEAAAYFYNYLKGQGDKPSLDLVVEEFRRSFRKARGTAVSHTGEDRLEGSGAALLQCFYEEVRPRKVVEVEYPFSVPLYDPDGGRPLGYQLVGVIDLVESDDEGNLIVAEMKTSSKRYADSQGENQLDGLVYAYALNQLGLRTTEEHTLIRYDVLIKTKTPAFQQIYFNKKPNDYPRFARWIKEILAAIDRQAFYPNFGWGCKQCQFKKACWQM